VGSTTSSSLAPACSPTASGRTRRCRSACAAPAGGGEGVVIDWLEDELAVGGLIAGYDLYKTVRPLLRSLAVPGRHLDLAALAVADKRRFHDLTERVATGVPVSFGQACSRASIAVTPPDQAQRQSWWATGDTPAMLLTLAREAVATWRLWLAQHVAATGDVALGRRAAAEFDVWRTRHPLPTVGPCDRSRSTTARYNEERS